MGAANILTTIFIHHQPVFLCALCVLSRPASVFAFFHRGVQPSRAGVAISFTGLSHWPGGGRASGMGVSRLAVGVSHGGVVVPIAPVEVSIGSVVVLNSSAGVSNSRASGGTFY